jgi:hypothetical protein
MNNLKIIYSALFILCLPIIIVLYSCDSSSKSPTSPSATPTTTTSVVTYNQSDLTGNWKGTAKNSSNTYNLDLTINSEGRVSGTAKGCIDGIQQTKTFLPEHTRWRLDSSGKITFSNQTWIVVISATQMVLYNASWSLQMGVEKKKITGTLDIDRSTLRNMDVTLHKK